MLKQEISVGAKLHAEVGSDSLLPHGIFWHVQPNEHGGSVSTPLGHFYVTQAKGSETFHPHLRLDCYFRVHTLMPDLLPAGKALAHALLKQKRITGPLWLSVHRAEEITGEAFGEVFDFG